MGDKRFLAGIWVGALAALVAFALWNLTRPAVGPRPAKLLGHLAYAVANPSALEPVDRSGEILMQPVAASALRKLQRAAVADGVLVVPVSGFRTLGHQHRLFYDGAAENSQTLAQRAFTCAPPGFSEHHTGYALDLGDGAYEESKLNLKFKDTKAYRWLAKNAARFHFELSFPDGNRQKVSYEPWHWRFVGDQRSFRTFYYARLEP